MKHDYKDLGLYEIAIVTVLIVNMFVIPMQLDVLILTSPCAVQRACRYAGGTFSYTSIMVLVVSTSAFI